MRSTLITCHDWEAPYKVLPTRKVKAQEFDEYRRIITDLYITEDHSLEAVRKIMAERYQFYGTEAQYKKKIRSWRLDKNVPQKKMVYLIRKKEQRQAEGKPSLCLFHGQIVEDAKLERSRLRFREELARAPASPTASTPSHVACLTPPLSPVEPAGRRASVDFRQKEASAQRETLNDDSEAMDPETEKNDMELDAPAQEFQQLPNSSDPSALFSEAVDLLEHHRYSQASPLFTTALTAFEALPTPSSYTAQSLGNLGLIYASQGNYTQAHEFYSRASSGGLEPHNAAGLNTNLGILYDHQGEYTRALESHQAALNSFQQLGDNTEVLAAYNNIGVTLRKKGDYDGALRHHFKALEGGDGAASLNNIGAVYHAKGQYEAALSYYLRSLSMRENAIFGDSVEALATCHNVGVCFDVLGRQKEAAAYLGRALKGYERVFGDNAKDTLGTLKALGNVYFKCRQYQRAADIWGREWRGKKKVLGGKDEETVKAKKRWEQSRDVLIKQRLGR
ncbi:hypothetical protein FN846DRAFT_903117 [Sphaerosporella brunnea]|uniref:Clr5 domain-containing protein n=1 Tax=Sphaerosporella brunnea TaxID=1250544 RepID=A0A5J5F7J6_9PEZI|nr:hypothetical protein FN846DRAFT_903117 [Sphaerosporella brunnea]